MATGFASASHAIVLTNDNIAIGSCILRIARSNDAIVVAVYRRVTAGRIYLLRGAAIVPQLLNANGAASLTGSSTSSIAHGAGNTDITLTGSHFIPGVAVTWNGSYRFTRITDPTHLTVAIPASDLAQPNTATLTAVNPGARPSTAITINVQ